MAFRSGHCNTGDSVLKVAGGNVPLMFPQLAKNQTARASRSAKDKVFKLRSRSSHIVATGTTFLTFAATILRCQTRVIFLGLPDEPLNAVATSAHLPAARCADVPTPPSVEDLADLTAKSVPVRSSKRSQS